MKHKEMFLTDIVKLWIAGEHLTDAVEIARRENREGSRALIGHVGEHVTSQAMCEQHTSFLTDILTTIKKERLRADLSVKLTQIGLGYDFKACVDNLERIARAAKRLGLFVWIDMEDAHYTQQAIDAFLSLSLSYPVAITLQANLKRTQKDMDEIMKQGSGIRLVKGAYHEPAAIAYQRPEEITRNYLLLMSILFSHTSRFAIATHDENIIEAAKTLQRREHREMEFQVLLGIRPELKASLLQEKYPVAVYVPFGKGWISYMLRRVREKKSDSLLILKAAIQQMLDRF